MNRKRLKIPALKAAEETIVELRVEHTRLLTSVVTNGRARTIVFVCLCNLLDCLSIFVNTRELLDSDKVMPQRITRRHQECYESKVRNKKNTGSKMPATTPSSFKDRLLMPVRPRLFFYSVSNMIHVKMFFPCKKIWNRISVFNVSATDVLQLVRASSAAQNRPAHRQTVHVCFARPTKGPGCHQISWPWVSDACVAVTAAIHKKQTLLQKISYG